MGRAVWRAPRLRGAASACSSPVPHAPRAGRIHPKAWAGVSAWSCPWVGGGPGAAVPTRPSVAHVWLRAGRTPCGVLQLRGSGAGVGAST